MLFWLLYLTCQLKRSQFIVQNGQYGGEYFPRNCPRLELTMCVKNLNWEQRFEQTLKNEVYEQFNMLLCDPARCPDEQRQLLHAILFVDHQNPKHWNAYLSYLTEKVPQPRESLIFRLIFKALWTIPEDGNKNHPDYIRLHLRLAELEQYELLTIAHKHILTINPLSTESPNRSKLGSDTKR